MDPAGGGRGELRRIIEHEVRYANIAIIEGNQASQFGIGIVAARIPEAVLRDERIVIPIGSSNSRYLTTLSMPSVVGRGVLQILQPRMTEEERQGLERSAATLRDVVVAGWMGLELSGAARSVVPIDSNPEQPVFLSW
jgi:malate/lactate dehydrogenase